MGNLQYVDKCWECNCAVYYNPEEEKYVTTSNLPDHQCRWGNEPEEGGDKL